METLNEYIKKRYSTSSAKRYSRDVEIYMESAIEPINAKQADIMNYVHELRALYGKSSNVNTIMASISKYYDWLVYTEQRKDNPCRKLNLKNLGKKDVALHTLFTIQELELLLDRVERYQDLLYRNKGVISLLIYQALTMENLINLEIHDFNLNKGEVFIRRTNRTNERTLQLKSNQILILDKYIREEREKLLRVKTDRLLITKLGTEEKGEGISYLISTFKSLFADRNLNPKTIRQSVIHEKFKEGKDIREIQLFSGVKYPSSIERYRPENDEEMKEAIEIYHPFAN